MDWREYIHSDPEILAGKPVVKGTRLAVDLLLGLAGAGWTQEQILTNYPTLTPEGLRAVFNFAADFLTRPEGGEPGMKVASILWRRVDRPGHEAARVEALDAGWRLAGSAVFLSEGRPCRLDYRVDCDRSWRTLACAVSGWVGSEVVEVEVSVEAGRWRLGGIECPRVEGCVDVDLNFSPSTNLLPIRRLGLAVGEEAAVRAAWLRFPSFALEPLEQTYRRLDEEVYRYSSAGGRFTADLRVSAAGLVTDYPGVWREETGD
jgi:uncharacterized protein